MDDADAPATFSGFEAYNTIPLKAGTGGGTIDPPVISGVRLLANGDLELTVTCTAGRVLVLQGAPALGGNWPTLQSTTPATSPATLVVPKADLVPQRFLRVYQE